MNHRGFNSFIFSSFWLSVLVLVGFAVLQRLDIPAGQFVDWLVGVGSFWWLVVITTVPWNIHFQAREVLVDAEKSRELNIAVNEAHLQFARTWVNRALMLAIALHLLSAAGLYALAATGISRVGYVGSAAALLLTGLRPIVRAYEYIAGQLSAIQQELRYPREDVAELRQEWQDIKAKVQAMESQLDLQHPVTWASQTKAYAEETRAQTERNRIDLDALRVTNQGEHERLARDAQHAIAQITADGQFLEHVREIIRFVKNV